MVKLHFRELESNSRELPHLLQAIHQITSVQAKYMGTAVGNRCSPASDVATGLHTLVLEDSRSQVKEPNH
jgi:CO/xanthine dehydrogenase FAD-binding subunit